MANKTVYPYGTGGSLPSSIGIINDRTTGGADKAWSAEQGKLACQDIEKNSSDIFDMFATEIDKNDYTLQVGWTITSNNVWQHVTNADKVNWNCVLIPITPGKRYRVYGNTTNQGIALLASDSMVADSSPDFCDGYTGRIWVSPGKVYDFIAPEDAAYLYFLMTSNGSAEDGTLASSDGTVPNVSAELGHLQGEIDIINSQRIDDDGVPVYENWSISGNGKWVDSSSLQYGQFACRMFPITPGEKYIVVAGEDRGGLFAILASNTKADNTTADFCEDFPGRMNISKGERYEFLAPEDAAFLYITIRSSGIEYNTYAAVPKTIDEQFQEIASSGAVGSSGFELGAVSNVAKAIGNTLQPLNEALDENGYVVPTTLQEMNTQKKAEQWAGVKWTPITAVPRNYGTTTNLNFPAGTQVTGLPYSSVKELDKYIGKDVSLHTFMTAVNNPYSLLYTENVSATNSQSAWGRTYHGKNCACFYGQVCSQFVAAAQGGPIDYATEIYPWVDQKWHGVVKVYDQSAQGAKAGDLFWYDGHCRMVYAVKKNSSGVVTHIVIAESNYPTTVINAPMTAQAFNAEIQNQGRAIYRPLWLYRNIDYVPSPYVAIRDETPQTVTYNDDICTFAGDKACFREGELIVINYNLKQVGAWTAMQLYKGSTLLDTITLDTSSHIVNLTSRNLTYGKYKARLTDGTNYSDYTEWEILQTNVSAVNNGKITTVTKSSANGKPVAIKLCGVNGGVYAMIELTDEQIAADSFDINFVELNEMQMHASPIRGNNGVYLKIYFQGEFGRVTNEPLPIYFN